MMADQKLAMISSRIKTINDIIRTTQMMVLFVTILNLLFYSAFYT